MMINPLVESIQPSAVVTSNCMGYVPSKLAGRLTSGLWSVLTISSEGNEIVHNQDSMFPDDKSMSVMSVLSGYKISGSVV